MKEVAQSLTIKSQVDTTLHTADKDRAKNIGRPCFGDDGSQNYLVFQPLVKSFTAPTTSDRILAWKPKGLSEEGIKPPAISDNSLAPRLTFVLNIKMAVGFKRSCLKQDKTASTHRNVIRLLIAYELDKWSRYLNTKLTLSDCLRP